MSVLLVQRMDTYLMSLTVRNKQLIETTLTRIQDCMLNNDDELDETSKELVKRFSGKIAVATSAFTNIVTCLVAQSALPAIDPRYHRQPGEDDNDMPHPPSGEGNWFSGRSISEKIVYPWLLKNGYRTAKSGWQTRTFERPRPYTLDYPENIAHVKDEFLQILDRAANGMASPEDILAHFFRLEEENKLKKDTLIDYIAKNSLANDLLISDIIEALTQHFSLQNSARLPVLAIYATYQLLLDDIIAYQNRRLEALSSHEAADLRTGAIGDIELRDLAGDVIEALEIKHRIPIDLLILLRAEEKIRSSQVVRYYILTTHQNCQIVDPELTLVVQRVFKEHGCQVIVNGVLPTIKYYLRLISDPKKMIRNYSRLLIDDPATRTSHVSKWKEILDTLLKES